jgi:hypothetical protein
VRARRRAGAQAFTELISKLPPAEVAALAAALPALEHLRELDTEQHDRSTRLNPGAQS